jgi:uncharacterized membrane protein (DUF4010 family)
MQPPLDQLFNLGVALLVALLIGLDRERAEERKRRNLFAGIRTFPLIALAGAIPALQVSTWGVAPLIASFAAFSALLAVAYYRSTAEGSIGATTESAALVTFLLGALAGSGERGLAAGIGIAVALLLNAKPRLERFSRGLTQQEIDSVLELGVISCIVLPVLPNRGMGPWQVWNPFEIWLVVVMVCALSFGGFVAMRWLGQGRGLLVSGAIGALVSSTAVTVSMAGRSRSEGANAALASAAATLASVVMCWRLLVLVTVAGGTVLVARLLAPIVSMSLVGLVASRWAARRAYGAPARSDPATLENPFSLKQALSFALIYAVVLVAMPAARDLLGTAGAYLAAGISSLVDVDAVSIAFARGASAGADASHAVTGITIAMIVNTLFKLGVAVAMGEGTFRKFTALGLGLMAIAGALAALGVNQWLG